LLPSDATAVITYKNGTVQKRELNPGNSFLSQSANFIKMDPTMASVVVMDNKGNKRNLSVAVTQNNVQPVASK
jgi:hypothetical protein